LWFFWPMSLAAMVDDLSRMAGLETPESVRPALGEGFSA
jgi:hypothetical protein